MTTPNGDSRPESGQNRPDSPAPRPMISGSRWRSVANHPRLVSFGWAPLKPAWTQRP